METVTNTIYGSYIQTCQLLRKDPEIKPYTTLNEKLNIFKDEVLTPGEIPTVQYVAVGNGGHTATTGPNGVTIPAPVLHTPRHAALYNQLPFVLRTPENDLTSVERANYRLRSIIDVNGTTYVAYYLKVLNLTNVVPAMEHKLVADGQIFTDPFTPTAQDLDPVPPNIDPNSTNTSTGEYLSATAKIPFTLDVNDIRELQDACRILYGTDEAAIISEVALCSGVDRPVEGDFNGTTATYTEAIAVQVSSFINTFYATKFINDSVNVVFDVGSVEPLAVL